ncbi:Holliday junction resolvase [Candidatus Woesearchaeota archaeon]|nr:Holliday junction resolvase [Candidatus Woesearchaeota archaeon]
MSVKSKGINAERELIHKFWSVGWAAIRVAGSGSSKYPSPDILAGNNLRKLAIECKASGSDIRYLTKKEIDELKEFSQLFGAESWIAVRFDRMEWHFVNLEDLKFTGANYAVTKELIKNKGLLLEEIIK